MVRPQAEPYTGIPRLVNPYQTPQFTNDDFIIPKENKRKQKQKQKQTKHTHTKNPTTTTTNRALTKIESKESF